MSLKRQPVQTRQLFNRLFKIGKNKEGLSKKVGIILKSNKIVNVRKIFCLPNKSWFPTYQQFSFFLRFTESYSSRLKQKWLTLIARRLFNDGLSSLSKNQNTFQNNALSRFSTIQRYFNTKVTFSFNTLLLDVSEECDIFSDSNVTFAYNFKVQYNYFVVAHKNYVLQKI